MPTRFIETRVDIDAPAPAVWDVLSDFETWGGWNPLIPKMRAAAKPHAKADFLIVLGGMKVGVQSWVARADAPAELVLKGPRSRIQHPLMHGEHYWKLQPLGEHRTRLFHGERFGGMALPLIWWWLRPRVEAGYQKMNLALKEAVEA